MANARPFPEAQVLDSLSVASTRTGSSQLHRLIDLVLDLVYCIAMAEVTIHEAKTHLSRLLRRVAAGEEIVITRGRTPVARLVPVDPAARRELGFDRGKVRVDPDFDAPLPEEILRDFEA